MSRQKILILDFGAQYVQLIARRVREAGVYCELHPWDVTDQFVREFAPQGVILSGGPASVTAGHEAPRAPQSVFELGVPVLGICYGMQTMAAQLGGLVENATVREFGHATVQTLGESSLFGELCDQKGPRGESLLSVWMSHGDKVTSLPSGIFYQCSEYSDSDCGHGR
ncbi:bifunctional GMP synthase/glutamine amidotransferase protein [mine drainage metagenome]|uniref:Bifunctional GMP synthase/glutamine amidotransferase protein n=1 Tax=mine drainage metagenome TaxID=410659 RepID=T1BBH2_9ZZZZ